MVICTVDEECSEHGVCQSLQCNCDLGWFGPNCSESGGDIWGPYWNLFRILFAVAFILLAAFAVKQLLKGMMLRKSLGCTRIAIRLVRSPKNLSVGLIVIATSLRGIWLCIDPLSLSGITSHLADRLLYDSVFPTMYCVYCSVLLVWSGLHHAVTSGKRDWSKGIRITIVVFMGVSFVVSISFSVCQGIRVSSGSYIIPGLIFVIIAVGSILVGLIFFGVLLIKYIKHSKSDLEGNVEQEGRNSLKLAYSSEQQVANMQRLSIAMPTATHSKASNESEGAFILIRNQSVPVGAGHYSSAGSSSAHINEEFDEEWSLSESSESIAETNAVLQSWSRFNSSMGIHQDSKSQFLHIKPAPDNLDKDRYIVMMSREDKMILRQIIILTTLSGIIGVTVIGLTVLIAVSEVVHESTWALMLLFLASGMEFFAYIVVETTQVLLIFSTHIKVKSKENLHFVSEVRQDSDRNADISQPREVVNPSPIRFLRKALAGVYLLVSIGLMPVISAILGWRRGRKAPIGSLGICVCSSRTTSAPIPSPPQPRLYLSLCRLLALSSVEGSFPSFPVRQR